MHSERPDLLLDTTNMNTPSNVERMPERADARVDSPRVKA
jgi:hypothetical protein